MPKRTDIQKILIIGAGPIVIGQACEFDYSGTQEGVHTGRTRRPEPRKMKRRAASQANRTERAAAAATGSHE